MRVWLFQICPMPLPMVDQQPLSCLMIERAFPPMRWNLSCRSRMKISLMMRTSRSRLSLYCPRTTMIIYKMRQTSCYKSRRFSTNRILPLRMRSKLEHGRIVVVVVAGVRCMTSTHSGIQTPLTPPPLPLVRELHLLKLMTKQNI